jgi:hypothetical protein
MVQDKRPCKVSSAPHGIKQDQIKEITLSLLKEQSYILSFMFGQTFEYDVLISHYRQYSQNIQATRRRVVREWIWKPRYTQYARDPQTFGFKLLLVVLRFCLKLLLVIRNLKGCSCHYSYPWAQ